jgi:cell division protein FtsB
MRVFKYLFGVWTAIAVYTILSFIGGPKGIWAYNYLLSEKDRQIANTKELEIINEELEISKNNLLYDHDTLLVHARKMGYSYEDDKFIRIVGLGSNLSSPAVTGKVYFSQNPDFIPDKSIKIAALCAGLFVFAFLFMLDFINTRVK